VPLTEVVCALVWVVGLVHPEKRFSQVSLSLD